MKLPIGRMTRMLWACLVFALLAASSGARAQAEAAPFKPEELEALVAPIALYPDSVLSQALMASTYPLEVVQAARWLKANPTLKGEAAVKAVANQSWDVSVKSLVVRFRTGRRPCFTETLTDTTSVRARNVACGVEAACLAWTDALGRASRLAMPIATERNKDMRSTVRSQRRPPTPVARS